MKRLPIVALIGQTNAGKSSLLNRFARKNIAIVAREEGTTRDNVVTTIDNHFILIDTAGLKDPNDDFEAKIQDQIEDAVDSADLILVTLDGTKYPDDKDRQIAKSALKSKKPVLLVLNKSDLGGALPNEEFLKLGIKDIFRISATTGMGTKELKSEILERLLLNEQAKKEPGVSDDSVFSGVPERGSARSSAEKSVDDRPLGRGRTEGPTDFSDTSGGNDYHRNSDSLTLALIGRPNVGKSSLFNSLAKKQQALVSSRQGTTRDINRVRITYDKKPIEILDTAGLRKPGKREVGIEKFSCLRTLAAIEEADVCALLIDATEPHAKLDQALAGQIVEAGKGIIVVVTKTDLLKEEAPDASPIDQLLNDLERDFDFLPYAPVLLTSSLTGKNVTKLFDLTVQVQAARHTETKTSDLNKILREAVAAHPPAGLKNTHPKPKYIVQTDICPPWFVIHGREMEMMHWSYKRYLERKIREVYPMVGTPIKFSFHNDRKDNNRKSPKHQ